MRVRVLYTGLAGIVLLLLASAAAATGLPPKITAVIPDYNPDGPDRLFIAGERLPGGPHLKVKLGDHKVTVLRSEPTLIVTRLPAGFPDGSYHLKAFNNWKVATFTASIVRDAVGTQGPQGEPGPIGPEGPPGPPGEDGLPGSDGADGAPGSDGADGAPGPKGDKGDKGDTGAQGEQGPVGSKGDKGDQGDPGLPGADGQDGEQGIPGDQGPAGEKGDKGDAGARGEQGLQGDPGLPGSPGADGEDGTSCTVIDNQNGTYTISCDDGTAATVADGPPGPQGEQGLPGETAIANFSCPEDELVVGFDAVGQPVCNRLLGGVVLPGGARYVFVTSQKYFPGVDFDGVPAADAICNELAASAGLPGTYKAWLSDELGNSPSINFPSTSGPYLLPNLVRVIDGLQDDLRVLQAPIDVFETGQRIPPGSASDTYVWTATSVINRELSPPACESWTSSKADVRGNIGRATETTGSWTGGIGQPCDRAARFYCFEQ